MVSLALSMLLTLMRLQNIQTPEPYYFPNGAALALSVGTNLV